MLVGDGNPSERCAREETAPCLVYFAKCVQMSNDGEAVQSGHRGVWSVRILVHELPPPPPPPPWGPGCVYCFFVPHCILEPLYVA